MDRERQEEWKGNNMTDNWKDEIRIEGRYEHDREGTA